MIFIITKNEDNIELLSSSEIKILNCASKDNVINITSEKCGDISLVDVYTSMIKEKSLSKTKLVIFPELLNTHLNEIMLMLASLEIVKIWDEQFWEPIDNVYMPKLDNMYKFIYSILINKANRVA